MRKFCGFMALLLAICFIAPAVAPAMDAKAYEIEDRKDYHWISVATKGSTMTAFVPRVVNIYGYSYEVDWETAVIAFYPVDVEDKSVFEDLSKAAYTQKMSECAKLEEVDSTAPYRATITFQQDIDGGYHVVFHYKLKKNVSVSGSDTVSGSDAPADLFTRMYTWKESRRYFTSKLSRSGAPGGAYSKEDGYVYIYVYETADDWSEADYPILYAQDKKTVISKVEDCTQVTHAYECEGKVISYSTFEYKLSLTDAKALGEPEKITYDDGTEYAYYECYYQWSKGDLPAPRNNGTPIGYMSLGIVDKVEKNDNVFKTEDGISVTVTETPVLSAKTKEPFKAVADLIGTDGTVKDEAALTAKAKEIAPKADIDKVTAAGTLEVSVPAGTDASKGIKIKLTNDKIKKAVSSNSKVLVLHMKADGNWEVLPAEAEDGAITATFTSFSPVIWMVVGEKDDDSDDEAAADTTAAAPTKSPKTGDAHNAVLYIMMAVCGACATVFCARKRYRR